MQPITITELTESECAAASEVILSSFVCAALQDRLPPDAITAFVREVGCEEAIRRRLGECRFTIAKLEDEIVGVAATRDDQLTYLFVIPINQRSDIGARLFHAAEQKIQSASHTALSLITIFPSSVPFFKAMGMQQTGTCEVLLGPDQTADGVVMRKVFES